MWKAVSAIENGHKAPISQIQWIAAVNTPFLKCVFFAASFQMKFLGTWNEQTGTDNSKYWISLCSGNSRAPPSQHQFINPTCTTCFLIGYLSYLQRQPMAVLLSGTWDRLRKKRVWLGSKKEAKKNKNKKKLILMLYKSFYVMLDFLLLSTRLKVLIALQ